MKSTWIQRFFYVLNFLLYMVNIFTWITMTDYLTFNASLSVFTISMTLAIVFKEKERWQNFATSRQFKMLITHGTQMLLILSIFALLNYLVFKNPKQWDTTHNHINTLSEKTVSILDSLDGPVKVTAFVNGKDALKILPLLDLYRLEKSDFIIDRIDPELRPDLGEAYGIKEYGEMVFQYRDKTIHETEYSEQAITSTIVKITSELDKKVYFVTGHRIKSLEDDSNQGLSELKKLLIKENFEIQLIDLRKDEPKVANDSLLVLWGPVDGLIDIEIDRLKKYLLDGGHFMAAIDPNLNSDPHAKLRELLKGRGIEISNDLVVDSVSHVSGTGGAIPIIKDFADAHPTTKSLKGDAFFPLVSSVNVHEIDGVETKLLAKTSLFPASWAEKNMKEVNSSQVTFTENTDVKGPIAVIASSIVTAGKNKGAKTLVFGDSDFVQNQYKNYQNNRILFLNSTHWLFDNLAKISFDLPQRHTDRVTINVQELQVIFYFAILFIPLIMFALAIVFYRKKYQ